MSNEDKLVRDALIESLSNRGDLDAYYMSIGSKSYTKRQLITSIENMDEMGTEFVKDIYKLTLDLLHRNKLKRQS